MPALFNEKTFNGEVFAPYQEAAQNLRLNNLFKSGAVVEKPQYVGLMRAQGGANYVTTPIKGGLAGKSVNYDGKTDIDTSSRGTFSQGRVVISRAVGFVEADFASDVTGGEDFTAGLDEIAEFWADEKQDYLISTLKGAFAMDDDDFVDSHTYTEGIFSETTLNNAIQKALGDNKGAFNLFICHSQIATNLENKNLTDYAKYTDASGIQADTQLLTLNGRQVKVDDALPVEWKEEGYAKANAYTSGALLVVSSGAKEGQVNLSEVTGDVEDAKAGDYVVFLPAGYEYTSYVLGKGAIEYVNVGATYPIELSRDPLSNGGETYIVSRERFSFAPVGISYLDTDTIAPEKDDLENGENWSVAKNGDTQFPIKAIPIVQIKTRG